METGLPCIVCIAVMRRASLIRALVLALKVGGSRIISDDLVSILNENISSGCVWADFNC